MYTTAAQEISVELNPTEAMRGDPPFLCNWVFQLYDSYFLSNTSLESES